MREAHFPHTILNQASAAGARDGIRHTLRKFEAVQETGSGQAGKDSAHQGAHRVKQVTHVKWFDNDMLHGQIPPGGVARGGCNDHDSRQGAGSLPSSLEALQERTTIHTWHSKV